MIYKKRVSSGVKYFKKGEDIRGGDVITIANEGETDDTGQYGPQEVFLIQLSNGEEGAINMNQTSINSLIDGYGEDSKNWIGKKAKIVEIQMSVSGKIRDVYFFVHPDAELDKESGQFIIGTKDSDIPVVDGNEEMQMVSGEDQED